MGNIMNLDDIKSFMPHREPMLLIENAEITGEGESYATYRIKEDEFFTRGHFPGNPIVPGVIQCEIMAQACAVSVKDYIPGHMTFYAGIDKVRFKNSVKPGDLCEIRTKMVAKRGSIFFFEAKLEVDGKLCCKGELSFALVPIPEEQK
ncbi:MAG: beta-hydroxyacyl-ACP dehydratase [Bacteroidales bacterium]|nr:beta-hydroxyacyl-ACP dehydratase [Candidatus Cryptobacteroides faecihippi]